MPIEFFTADDGVHGRELWMSDGTLAGTLLFADLDPGSAGSNPSDFIVSNGIAYFLATDGKGGGVYRTDGTSGGTFALSNALTEGGQITNFTVAGDGVFWLALGPPGDPVPVLCFSNGAAASGIELFNPKDPNAPNNIQGAVALGNDLIFSAHTSLGTQLWISDGTVAGTHVLDVINATLQGSSFPTDLTVFDGEVYFTANDGVNGNQLWRTDGTLATTQMVTDLSAGLFPTNMTVIGGKLFFIANDSQGPAVWASDGTAAGTTQLTQGVDSWLSVASWDFQAVGGKLYFGNNVSGFTTAGLFVSDGTVAGTVMLANIEVESTIARVGGGLLFAGALPNDGASGLFLERVAGGTPTLIAPNVIVASEANAGGKLFLELSTVGGNDTQLWVSNGTVAGTKLVMDFSNGVSGGNAGAISAFGNDVLFSAPAPQVNGLTTDQTDNELWISDGTTAGTREVKNINAPTEGGGSLSIDEAFVSNGVFIPIATVFDSKFVFAGMVNGIGPYLMASDGTQVGTDVIGSAPSGQVFSSIRDFAAVGSDLFFIANQGVDDQLWVTDGSAGSGTMLTGPANGFAINGNSTPSFLSAFDGKLFFGDQDAAHGGAALYTSDGTVAGTQFFAQIDVQSQPVVLGAELVFFGFTSANGGTIYATDGTPGDVALLGPPGDTVSNGVTPNPTFTVSGSKAFFALGTLSTGDELWVTDGTAAGTRLVKDIAAGSVSSNPTNLTAFDGGIVFTADDGVHGSQVWFSDGTAAGTFELLVNPGADPSASLNLNPHGAGIAPPMVQFDGQVWFSANDGFHGIQLWSSDGTAAGTQMLGPFSGSNDASYLTPFSGGLFFSGGPGSNPYVTDGTFAGTVELSSSIVGVAATFVVDNKLVFVAQQGGASDPSLFTTDGTVAGTAQLSAVGTWVWATDGDFLIFWSPGDPSHTSGGVYGYDAATGSVTFLNAVKPLNAQDFGNPIDSATIGGRLVFDGGDGTHGNEPWVTDGTVAGTFLLDDIVSGASGSSPDDFTAFNGKVYFATTAGPLAIWATDGTAAGTAQAVTVSDAALSGFSFLEADGSDLLFVASFSNKGPQLWDYSAASGTAQEVAPFAQTGFAASPVVAGGVLYFQELDVAGVTRLGGFTPGSGLLTLSTAGNGDGASYLTPVGSKLFFVGAGPTGGYGLFVTSGTLASTTFLTAFPSLGTGLQMAAIGGQLYFQGSDATNGAELWVSDGTVAGTHRVSNTATPESANANQFTVAGGQVFFSATDGAHGQELWAFNGAPGGAHMVVDLDPGDTGSNPTDLVAFDGKLFFLADDGSGQALWSSDGTAGGTVRITTASKGGDPSGLTVAGSDLFFYSTDSTNGAGLFVTDGTAAGTRFLATASDATNFVVVGAELYFQAFDSVHGTEIWKSDGTSAGTVRVTDIALDNGSFPQSFFSLSPNVTTTTETARDDFNGDGQSDFLIQNAAGVVVTGEDVGGAPAYAAVTDLGSEWQFRGNGDFLGDAKEAFLIQNSAGAVFVSEVSGGSVSFSQVAALGSEWSFKGAGDLLGDAKDQFLIENSSGVVVVGEVVSGTAAYTAVSALGPEWSFHGIGDFNGDGQDDYLIQNQAGVVAIGEVKNGSAVYAAVTDLVSEWKFVGTGDFLGDGKDDFLIQNTAGQVDFGEVSSGSTTFTAVTQLGSEWKFVAAGDYLGEGHDQFLIENASGAVVIGDWTGGAIHFTQVAALGPEWVFH